MKTTITGLLGSAILLSSTSNIFAAEQDAVIVTATRTAQTVDESLASVTVITEDDIQRSQANSIQELLNGLAGINFVNSGGAGKTTSLFLRGTNSDHIVVMIDGIKIGSATSGDVPFQNIPVSQIERIEVVRGPRSSLYGSEAIGGVIQIFTKKGKNKSGANFNIELGSYDTHQVSAGLSRSNNKTAYHMQLSSFSTAGFDAQDTRNPDKDGYQNDSLNANISHKFSDQAEWSINFLHLEGVNDYDGFTKTSKYESRIFQQSVGTSLKLRPSNFWQTELSLSQNRDESDNIKDDIQFSRFDSERRHGLWQNDITINQSNMVTLGIDYTKEKVDSTTSFAKKERYSTGEFFQYQWTGEDNDILIGRRADRYENFGIHQTGSVAWGKKIGQSTRFILSYGTAFKAPTFNDLYYSGAGGAGNPNLEPEESYTQEAILRGKHWEISAYKTKVRDLIVWQETAPSSFFYMPSNVDNATIEGLDISAKKQYSEWHTQLDISFANPRNDVTNKILPRRTRKSIRISADKTAHAFQYGATIIGYSERYDDIANNNLIKDYWLLNLRASYNLTKAWTLKARVENALDEDYETAKGYNQAGFSMFASINYQGF